MKNLQSGILIVVLLAGISFYIFSLNRPPLGKEAENFIQEKMQGNDIAKLGVDQIHIEDIKIGEGAKAEEGNTVRVNYIGTLIDGRKFDDSYEKGSPFEFLLGRGYVVKGFDMGVLGMKVGGKRKFAMHPTLGYGDKGVSGAIPPNSVLIFEVELLDVK